MTDLVNVTAVVPPGDALVRAGSIVQGDDRAKAVAQIAPPLIRDRPLLDAAAGHLGEVHQIVSAHTEIPDRS